MRTIGEAALQSDENGLITLQCHRCNARFKMEVSYLKNELEGEICCPVCGMADEPDNFHPDEVIEAAKQMVMAEADKIINEAFKGLNCPGIKVTTPPVKPHNMRITFKNKDYDMQTVMVPCCKRMIALKPVNLAAGFYCPYCGRIAR